MVLATSAALPILVLFTGKRRQLTRWHGLLFLVIFIAYQSALFIAR